LRKSSASAIEQKKKPSPAKETGGRLLLTEEEWMVRMKSCDGSGSNSNAHGRAGNSGGKSGSEKNKNSKSSTGEEKKSLAGHNDMCGYRGKKGHWARECRKKKHDE
jgi:hypothetical protein